MKIIDADRMSGEVNEVTANIATTLELDVGKMVALGLLLEKWVESQPKYSEKTAGASVDGFTAKTFEIVSYLNKRLGTHYKPTTKKTQMCIRARFNEGFDVDDFKAVIDFKADQWGSDERMVEYLRPETLFGNKFEGYLQNATRSAESHGNEGRRKSTWQ